MTPARLAEIRARLAAATPGPWYVAENDLCGGVIVGPADKRASEYDTRVEHWICDPFPSANAELIANAPSDIGELLAEVERLDEPHTSLGARIVEWAKEIERKDAEITDLRAILGEFLSKVDGMALPNNLGGPTENEALAALVALAKALP